MIVAEMTTIMDVPMLEMVATMTEIVVTTETMIVADLVPQV